MCVMRDVPGNGAARTEIWINSALSWQFALCRFEEIAGVNVRSLLCAVYLGMRLEKFKPPFRVSLANRDAH
jgi:hypothetical protein